MIGFLINMLCYLRRFNPIDPFIEDERISRREAYTWVLLNLDILHDCCFFPDTSDAEHPVHLPNNVS